LSVADGDLDWQPLAPRARRLALEEGMVNPAFVRDTPEKGHVAIGEPTPALTIDGLRFALLNGDLVELVETELPG
jgi:hypothetical protein